MKRGRRRKDLRLQIELPPWAQRLMDEAPRCRSDEDTMRFVVRLARENVERGAGGPFGAAVFRQPGNRLVAVGVNSVERLRNSILHAEIVALMLAEARAGSYSLKGGGRNWHEMVTSCEPCAMCLGAALWSGVRRIVCGASRSDAMRLGFDEGPVFPQSYRYLAGRGIKVVRGILAGEASEVLELYRRRHGPVYNA